MLRDKPVTAIIPARGGSKGIPRKNLLELGGDTLLERTIKFARAAPSVDRVIVSTDDPEMYDISKRYDVAAPALRPAEHAGDAAKTEAAVDHLIDQAGISDGWLLLLQVTSPLRVLKDLAALVALLEATPDADAAVSLCRHTGPHPAKMLTVEEGRIAPFMERKYTGPRQALPDVYVLNGAFYLVALNAYLRENTFLPEHTVPFVMPEERSANIDTPTDWQVLQAMIAQGYWPMESYE